MQNTYMRQTQFTSDQLQTIIDSYLGMDPYASILIKLLEGLNNSKMYGYSEIVECINSKQFYQLVPRCSGSLLTTTNIRIILYVLRFLGQSGSINIGKRMKLVRKFSLIVSLLTIYQNENNTSFIPDSIEVINSILKNAALMITHQIYTKNRPLPKIQQGKIFIDEILPICRDINTIEQVRAKLINSIEPEEYDQRTKILLILKMNVNELNQQLLLNDLSDNANINISKKENKKEEKKKEQKGKGDEQQLFKMMLSKCFAKKQVEKDTKNVGYNKMILNGLLIRKQVQEELIKGISIITDQVQSFWQPQFHIKNLYNFKRKEKTRRVLKKQTIKECKAIDNGQVLQTNNKNKENINSNGKLFNQLYDKTIRSFGKHQNTQTNIETQ